jgi:sphingolipid 8-(E)-desaturase
MLVKQAAKDEGLAYHEFGFREGNRDVVGVLKNVANQVSIMANVANVEAREAVEKRVKEHEESLKNRA